EAALARVDAAATEGPLPTKRHVLERDRRRGSQGPERADPDSIADHPRASLARPDADLDVHLLDRPAAAGPGAAVEVHVGGRPRVRVEALVADAGGGRIAPVDVGERRRWLIFAGLELAVVDATRPRQREPGRARDHQDLVAVPIDVRQEAEPVRREVFDGAHQHARVRIRCPGSPAADRPARWPARRAVGVAGPRTRGCWAGPASGSAASARSRAGD